MELLKEKHGREKAGRPARTCIQQICADTGYGLEDGSGAMDNTDWWREREGQGDQCLQRDMMMMMMMKRKKTESLKNKIHNMNMIQMSKKKLNSFIISESKFY